MNKLIMQKLEVVQQFQNKYPDSHIGGSIGLMLLGIDLQRDLSKSDLDITAPDFIGEKEIIDNYELRSDGNDFDYAIQKNIADGIYIKIDIRISPEPSFDVVNFNGTNYNVSKLKNILFWKKKYSDKGVLKHTNDLITIETGIRPAENINNDFDLPW